MKRGALISECGQFRYLLSRRWAGDGGTRPLLFVMLNPSTADADVDDPTIRRCIAFAKAHAYEAMQVVNLFAFRTTYPADLKRVGCPVGPQNDAVIESAVRWSHKVCVAWGAHASHLRVERRVQDVMPMLWRNGYTPWCLQITRSGYPAHPLMLRADCRLQPFTLEAVDEAMHRAR